VSRASHLALAILAGVALLASILLPLDPPDVTTCGFLWLTGYPCPFCGMTRAFTAMGHGQWGMAARQSPAGAIFYVATIGIFVFNLTSLFRPIPIKFKAKWLLIAGTLVLLANWVYRLMIGLR
jgi:hypothetical protein